MMQHGKENECKIPLGIYRHYKGGIYEVIANATHSETCEDMVVYRNIDTEAVWVRPSHMWNELVTHDGKVEPRFAFLASGLDEMDAKPFVGQ